MSSQQATLGGFVSEATDSPDEPEPAPDTKPEPEHDVPNFDRECGEERTKLGASLDELCAQAHEYEPRRPRRQTLNIEGAADEESEI